MAVFKSLGETAEGAADKAKDYAKYTEAYIKLQIFKHIAVLMTFVFKVVLIGGFLLTALLFLSVSLIVVLSDWFGSLALACASVGGLFLVLGLVIYLNRKYIDKKILVNLSETLH